MAEVVAASPRSRMAKAALSGVSLNVFISLVSHLLSECFKPRQNALQTRTRTAAVIQLGRRTRVHDAHAAGAAIGKALEGDFRVGKGDNAVTVAMEQGHRSLRAP